MLFVEFEEEKEELVDSVELGLFDPQHLLHSKVEQQLGLLMLAGLGFALGEGLDLLREFVVFLFG